VRPVNRLKARLNEALLLNPDSWAMASSFLCDSAGSRSRAPQSPDLPSADPSLGVTDRADGG
jgi:hypothetical protein